MSLCVHRNECAYPAESWVGNNQTIVFLRLRGGRERSMSSVYGYHTLEKSTSDKDFFLKPANTLYVILF